MSTLQPPPLSCATENKVVSTAIMLLLMKSKQLTVITQKFCEARHSQIQEVDNLHSQLEKALQCSEVYSPVGLVRLLKGVPRRKPIKLVQLKEGSIYDYHTVANAYDFKGIPFSEVKALQYSSESPMTVKYKLSFFDND